MCILVYFQPLKYLYHIRLSIQNSDTFFFFSNIHHIILYSNKITVCCINNVIVFHVSWLKYKKTILTFWVIFFFVAIARDFSMISNFPFRGETMIGYISTPLGCWSHCPKPANSTSQKIIWQQSTNPRQRLGGWHLFFLWYSMVC